MSKDICNENRSKFVLAFASLLLLAVITLALFGLRHIREQRNDIKIQNALSSLTYTQEKAGEELALLQAISETAPVSDAAAGSLYRAATEISYMLGDDMLYNHYISHALYYLNRVGDDASCAYLTNNYIGRLYANGCYKAAWSMLESISDNYNINSLAANMQARYYLCCADVAQMDNSPVDEYLLKAAAAIELMPESGERALFEAKHSIITARGLLLRGDFEKAQSTLAGYSEQDSFGLGEGQVYVVCDYKIPFYELTAKLALHNNELERAHRYTGLYLNACDEYRFRDMKLRMIQYMASNTVPAQPELRGKYAALEKSVTQVNLTEMTEQYGSFLLSDIASRTKNIDTQVQRNANGEKLVLFALSLACALILLYVSICVSIDYINRDSLTGLGNRKKYERIQNYCEKNHIPHCLILLDIDDFKNINDTFGHLKGDDVLCAICKVIKGYSGRGISCYRYGGDELCMMLLKVPESRAREIAHEIHLAVQKAPWQVQCPVTVSMGVAVSLAGENIFLCADQNLYSAKGNGKNQVC